MRVHQCGREYFTLMHNEHTFRVQCGQTLRLLESIYISSLSFSRDREAYHYIFKEIYRHLQKLTGILQRYKDI